MSKIHYFQRFSQKENVVTNNTLLLLSRLYAHNPLYLEAFLNDLVETQEPIEVGPTFSQQVRVADGGIPDASVDQKSFKVVIETKTQTGARLDQLTEHLKAFSDEETKVLILLSPTEQDEKFRETLREKVKDFNLNTDGGREVVEVCTTFDKLIRSFGGSIAEHDHEMRELLEDYQDFCFDAELLPRDGSRMRGVPCGKTFDDNFELKLYYQPVTRSSRPHSYLGIYKNKSIRYIGQVSKVVRADLVDGELRSDVKVEPDEQDQIRQAIHRAESLYGARVATGHEFYLVEKFCETSFEKISPGGLMNQRYFDLVNELGLDNEGQLPSVEEIARLLKGRTWR